MGGKKTINEPIRILCYRRSSFRLFIYIQFFIGYLSFGALCFMWLEGPIEEEAARVLHTKRREFLSDYPCVTMEAMENLLTAVSNAGSVGVYMVGNTTSSPNWDFGQSIFFAMTIITTIGYGYTTPATDIGKGFTILYALIGIPLTLVLFSAAVERIYRQSHKLLIIMHERFKNNFTNFDIRMIHLGIIGFLVGIFFMILPSIVLTQSEQDWNFLYAVYYCFISLSTIGLGDFVPGENAPPSWRTLYKIIVSIYLFLGLIATLVFLEFFHQIPELNFGYQIYRASDGDEEADEADMNQENGEAIPLSPSRKQSLSRQQSTIQDADKSDRAKLVTESKR